LPALALLAQHLHQPAAHCNHAPQGETEAIGKLLEKTQLQKYGPAELNQRFMIMDTICDATQARGCTALHFVLAGPS
jgi:4-hydroxy-3-methylbut-2-enyl diphosphate reductase IspH